MPLPLPIEIVEYILDLAGAFPDLSAHMSPPYPIHSSDVTEDDLPLSAIKLSASSLFSLTLVCKLWNTICTPRLYRCLAIVDDTDIDALLRTLEQSQITATVSGNMHLGSLTRNLIISLSNNPPVNVNRRERFERRIERRFGSLGRLARCLPHLELLSISIFIQDMWNLPRPYYGKDFAASVTQTCAPSLLKLHLHHDIIVLFSRQELRKLLESSPNLLAITGRGVGECIGCPVTLPHLPKLKYLVVNSIMRCDHIGHEDDRTPNLDHIHTQQNLLSNDWAHLLSIQSARLISVSLDLRLSHDTNTSSEYLSKFTKFCPNLSYLEICINNWVLFPRLELLPPVERFGIHIQACNTGVDAICKALATIQSSSLKVIQLMSPGIFERFASSDNVKNAWSPLVDHSFRVVDCDGRELGPPK
jgi:hypothetical protein